MDLLEDDFDRKIMKLMDLKKQNGVSMRDASISFCQRQIQSSGKRRLNGTGSVTWTDESSCGTWVGMSFRFGNAN